MPLTRPARKSRAKRGGVRMIKYLPEKSTENGRAPLYAQLTGLATVPDRRQRDHAGELRLKVVRLKKQWQRRIAPDGL